MSLREFKKTNPDLYRRIEKAVSRKFKPVQPEPVVPHYWKDGKLVPVGKFGF